MNSNAMCWEVKYCGKPVGFCAVFKMPRCNGPAMARIHRIVIHPDWQGIGLGRMLATTVAKHVSLQYDCFLQTSNIAMKHALLRYDDWKLVRNNTNIMTRKHALELAGTKNHNLAKASRRVKTASFVIRKHR